MSLFALVSNNAVVETASETFPVNPAFIWVDITSISPTPAFGWTYTGSAFVAPTIPEIDMRPQAQSALDKTDMTALRCFKAGKAFPSDWQAYVAALRAIVTGPSTTTALPGMPDYPAGT